jgi:hypothetical protein
MDCAYQGRHPPEQLATMTTHKNEDFGNHEWLADSGANTHATTDPSHLTDPQPFDGPATVGVGNGPGLSIQHIGSSLVKSPTSTSHNFLLSMHCPLASTNLLSINKLCKDNKC